jgi:sulfur-oxidizing protein SoxY
MGGKRRSEITYRQPSALERQSDQFHHPHGQPCEPCKQYDHSNDQKEKPMKTNRREMLAQSATVMGLLATAGLLPQAAHAAWTKAAFEAKSVADAIKALGGNPSTESKDITLTGPDIAENGAVVPVGCSTNLPGVKRMAILVEKNPSVLAAVFDVSDAVDANFSTRVKMGQSSNVCAVAMMGDGRVLFSGKEIKVTLGGCGG